MHKTEKPSLQTAFVYTEQMLQTRLESANFPHHSSAKGDVSEFAWKKFIKRYLPSRYSVDSGFVIDAHDKTSDQIDLIIYDKSYTPAFWGGGNHSYILAEAVHAVFEVKKNANSASLEYASKKAKSVRNLYRTSVPYKGSGQDNPPKKLFHIIGGLLATKIEPDIGSPAFNENIKKYEKYEGDGCIDMVLTAHNGYAHYFPTGQPPCMETGTGSATKGLFVLIQALIAQGTVSAVDLDYYLRERESV